MKKLITKIASILFASAFIFSGCGNRASVPETSGAEASEDALEEEVPESGSFESSGSSGSSGSGTAIAEPQEKEKIPVGVIHFEKEQKAVSLDDEASGNHYGEITYELLHIKDGGDEKSNGVDLTNLSEALDEMNAEIEGSAEADSNAFKNDYTSKVSAADIIPENLSSLRYNHTSNIKLERADDDAVSIVVTTSASNAGTYSYHAVPYCFNPITGQHIKWKDVIKDTTALQEKVRFKALDEYTEFFGKHTSAKTTINDGITALVSDPDSNSSRWFITPFGIDFIFNDFETFSKDADISPFIELTYSDNTDMFNPDITYNETPDGTLTKISTDSTTTINGKKLTIDSTYDEANGTNGFSAFYDDKEIPLNGEVNAYMADAYIARRGDKYFLLMEFHLDNDIPDMSIYDLALGKELPTQFEYSFENGLNFDLDNLTITRRLDSLSTVDGVMNASFTSDGLIVPSDKEYIIYSMYEMPNSGTPLPMAHTLTAKKDIRCIDGTIKEGEIVKIIKTNADEKAQTITLMKSDNTTVTVLVETKEDGTHTIDGADENELFDGIMYSG